MKKNIKLDKETLLAIYYENKELVAPIFAIVVSVLLILVFIIPQLLTFPSRKSAVDSEVKILDKIKESEKILTTANIELINSQVQLVAKVLPEKKPHEEALLAISTAAGLSNVQIEGFSHQEITEVAPQTGRSSIIFSVNIFGELDQAADFADQIYKTYPISSIEGISSSGGISTVLVKFYYSPFIVGDLSDRTTVRASNTSERSALEEITTWNEAIGGDMVNLSSEDATESASNSPF